MSQIIIEPGERRQTEIIIQTRKGNNILNIQEHELIPYLLHLVEEYDRQYKEPFVFFVNNPSPIYNCHGLVFGNRRAQIWDSQEIAKIIKEDDYTMVDMNNVRVGDVIIYYGDNGDAEHSGLVIGKKGVIPLILSKWGFGREAVHTFNQCPYSFANIKYYRISK
ncbi:MAG: hypothetical protein ABSG22_03130 [Sedimentisphaerales bacterium]|jgi:hypothetical protein